MVLGMVGKMTYVFFMVLNMVLNMVEKRTYVFFTTLVKFPFSKFFFYHRNSFFKQIPTKIVEQM